MTALIRVEVDFNERDRSGDVRTSVPEELVDALFKAGTVTLVDPVDGLQALATCTRVSRFEDRAPTACFAVDWDSFEDCDPE